MKKKIILHTALDLMQSPNLAKIKKPEGAGRIREVIFTKHAEQRLRERFQVSDPIQMEKTSKEAILEGQLYMNGHSVVIKHHSLLLVGWKSNGTLTITTAINRNTGISKSLHCMICTKQISPKPFETDLIIIGTKENIVQMDKSTKHQTYMGGTESNRFKNLPIENIEGKAHINSAGGQPIVCPKVAEA